MEKEDQTIMYDSKKFYQHIYGRNFTLVTDHKPLTTILNYKTGLPALAAAHLQQWAILLSVYQYDIIFQLTQQHANADGLSRLPLSTIFVENLECDNSAALFNINQIGALPVKLEHGYQLYLSLSTPLH